MELRINRVRINRARPVDTNNVRFQCLFCVCRKRRVKGKVEAIDFTSLRTSSGQARWPYETVPNGTISRPSEGGRKLPCEGRFSSSRFTLHVDDESAVFTRTRRLRRYVNIVDHDVAPPTWLK